MSRMRGASKPVGPRSGNPRGSVARHGPVSSRGSGRALPQADKKAGASVLATRTGFLVIVACLLIFGLVMLYSASSIYSYNLNGDYTAIFFKQMFLVAIGLIVALAVALIPYQKYRLPLCVVALLVTIALLIIVLFQGDDALGARRQMDIILTTLQPSEFAKIAVMLVLAHLVDRCRTDGYSPRLILLMIIACAVPLGLIIIEPDLGTTIIAMTGILAVLWFGGVPKRIVGLLALGTVALGIIAIAGTGFRQTRISSWLDPWSDPQVSGYQLLSSYYAFGGGGVTGVGLGLSKQKFNWLPQGENDFLFAIVGEELGLIGALVVMLLFVGLVVMALRIAAGAPDARGAMLAGASGVVIGGQAFLNMLCVVGAFPTTGKPLPFFSAGGSSIISTMLLVGLILSVSLQSSDATVYDFRREQFTVVQGGNRRGTRAGTAGSVLSRLPNPAAAVSALLPRTAATDRKRAVPGRVASGRPAPGRMPPGKVVPISRGRAQRSLRERERRVRAEAPLSMASLRRNRVRKTGTGGGSA